GEHDIGVLPITSQLRRPSACALPLTLPYWPLPRGVDVRVPDRGDDVRAGVQLLHIGRRGPPQGELGLANDECRLRRFAKRDHRRGGFDALLCRGRVGGRFQVEVDLGTVDRQPAVIWIDSPPRPTLLPREGLA